MPTGQGVFPQDLQLDSSALQSILQQHAPGVGEIPGEIPSENDRKTTGGSKTMIVVVVKQLI